MSDHIANQSSHIMLHEVVLSKLPLSLATIPPDSSYQVRHHRQRHRFCHSFFISSSRIILLVLCWVAVKCRRSHAFLSPIPHITSRFGNINTSSSWQGENCLFYSVAERPAQEANLSYQSENKRDAKPRLSDFQQRMRGLMKRNGVSHNRQSQKPVNLKTVHTLLDYKKEIENSNDKIVVVRFFATWCKVRPIIAASPLLTRIIHMHIQRLTCLRTTISRHAKLYNHPTIEWLPFTPTLHF